ncbi:hypothetical protein PMAYCL1PPCAC_13826, partial [Pristionchus mayeri]
SFSSSNLDFSCLNALIEALSDSVDVEGETGVKLRRTLTEFGTFLTLLEDESADSTKDQLEKTFVSSHFRAGVKEYMSKEKNRPAVNEVELTETEDGLRVDISLFSQNLPFYGLSNLDWDRFEWVEGIVLRVNLNGPQDPAIQQVSQCQAPILQLFYRSIRFCEYTASWVYFIT